MTAAAGKNPSRGGSLVCVLKRVVNRHAVHGHPHGAEGGVGRRGVVSGVQGDSKGLRCHHNPVGIISATGTGVVLAEFEGRQTAGNCRVPAIGDIEAQNGGDVVGYPVAGDHDLIVGEVLG